MHRDAAIFGADGGDEGRDLEFTGSADAVERNAESSPLQNATADA